MQYMLYTTRTLCYMYVGYVPFLYVKEKEVFEDFVHTAITAYVSKGS